MALDKEKTLDLAQKFIVKGQTNKAIAEYIKLIEADPKDKRLYLKLGDLYYKDGKNEKAISEYMKLAHLYAEEDLNLRAISIYKKVLGINPKHIDSLHKIAGLYLKEGLTGDARNYYQTILELKGDDKEALRALNNLDISQSQQKDSFKIGPSVEALSTHPSSPLTGNEYLHRADEIKPFGDQSDLFPSSVAEPRMLPELGELPSQDKDSEMHYHLGIAYKEMELFDYAISEFEMAASNPAIKFDCYLMLGSCFLEKGDSAQAIQYLKEAARFKGLTNEKLAHLHFNLGLAYEASGMLSKAVETFNLVLKLDRTFSEAKERIRRLQQPPK